MIVFYENKMYYVGSVDVLFSVWLVDVLGVGI